MRSLLLISVWLFGLVALPSALGAENFYTKNRTTDLKDAPRSREAAVVAQLGYSQELKLIERDGPWLKVSARVDSKQVTGWVYEGHVAEKRPFKDSNINVGTSADQTSASVAARPLNETAKGYATMKGKAASAADIEWMEKLSDGIGPSQVVEFLGSQKRGEFK